MLRSRGLAAAAPSRALAPPGRRRRWPSLFRRAERFKEVCPPFGLAVPLLSDILTASRARSEQPRGCAWLTCGPHYQSVGASAAQESCPRISSIRYLERLPTPEAQAAVDCYFLEGGRFAAKRSLHRLRCSMAHRGLVIPSSEAGNSSESAGGLHGLYQRWRARRPRRWMAVHSDHRVRYGRPERLPGAG